MSRGRSTAFRGHEGSRRSSTMPMYIVTPYPNVAYVDHAAGFPAVEVPAGNAQAAVGEAVATS